MPKARRLRLKCGESRDDAPQPAPDRLKPEKQPARQIERDRFNASPKLRAYAEFCFSSRVDAAATSQARSGARPHTHAARRLPQFHRCA